MLCIGIAFTLFSCVHLPPDSVDKDLILLGCPVCLSGQILLPRYLMNGLNSFHETDREYSPAATDDLIRFWRSKVKVTAGLRGQIL